MTEAARLAVVGLGRLGKACADAILASPGLALAGVVRHAEGAAAPAPERLRGSPVAAHAGELGPVAAALVCVPPAVGRETACHLLERGIPVVECARLHGDAFRAHFEAIDRAADRARRPAVVGAGWDPGALAFFEGLLGLVAPGGHTDVRHSPGTSLHHTLAARSVAGVRDALSTELRGPEGRTQRYVYVELEPGADLESVAAVIRADPLFLDEETLVLPIASAAELEDEGHGVVLERRGSGAGVAHPRFLVEGRFDPWALAAQVMVAAARSLETRRRPGARTLLEVPLAALLGDGRARDLAAAG